MINFTVALGEGDETELKFFGERYNELSARVLKKVLVRDAPDARVECARLSPIPLIPGERQAVAEQMGLIFGIEIGRALEFREITRGETLILGVDVKSLGTNANQQEEESQSFHTSNHARATRIGQINATRVKMNLMPEMILAIDYGTSNSLVAATDGVTTTPPLAIDPEAEDPTVFRSILFFPHGNLCYYGSRAVREYTDSQAQGRLIRSIKKYLPSESFLGSWIDNRVVKLEDLISYFLLEMRKRAGQALNQDVTSVVLGRPAKFSDDPVKDKLAEYRLQKAAELAGFKNISFLPEPLAAAFDLRRKLTDMKTVLVVDLGGGTSDFTVIRIGPDAYKESDVLAMGGVSVAGDAVDGSFMRSQVAPFLGSKVKYRVPLGRNVLEMPKSLLDHICSPADIAQLQKSDYMNFFRQVRDWALREEDREALERLFAIVEDQRGFEVFEEVDRVKRALSGGGRAKFSFDYPGAEIEFEIESVDYDVVIYPSTEKILSTMDQVLKDAGLKPDQIDIVYCTGGTSKLRRIQGGLLERFPRDRVMGANFFHSVIEGLTARAAEL